MMHARLIQALTSSRLDCGNALVYNIALSRTNCLQRVQNCAPPVVKGARQTNM